MVVVEEKLVGIFTERDGLFRVLAKALDPDTTEIGAVMTSPVMTITADRLVAHALHTMHDNGFRHMPVVEHGMPVGMISIRDALGAELVTFEHECEFKELLLETMR